MVLQSLMEDGNLTSMQMIRKQAEMLLFRPANQTVQNLLLRKWLWRLSLWIEGLE